MDPLKYGGRLNGRFQCPFCPKNFTRGHDRNRHIKLRVCQKNEDSSKFQCEICKSHFARQDTLKRHRLKFHGMQRRAFECGLCDEFFTNMDELRTHRDRHRELSILQATEGEIGEEASARDKSGFTVVRSAHGEKCELLRYFFPSHVNTIDEASKIAYSSLLELIAQKQLDHKHFNLSVTLNAEFVKIGADGTIDSQLLIPFRSRKINIKPLQEYEENVKEALFEIRIASESFTSRGSGWTINDVINLEVEFSKCSPILGGCNLHKVSYGRGRGPDIEMKSILPVSHDDLNDCFYLAVASYFIAEKTNATGTTLESQARQFAKENFHMKENGPVALEDVITFEIENQHLDLAVNVVYRDEDDNMYPVHVSSFVEAKHKIILFVVFLGTEDEFAPQFHYGRVENINALFAPRSKSKDGKKIYKREGWFCFNCFNYQARYSSHMNHIKWCHQKKGQHVIMPKKGETIKYSLKSKKEFTLAYLLFFDFETLQEKPKRRCACDDDDQQKGEPKKKRKKKVECTHKTKTIADHVAFSYSYVLVDRNKQVVEDYTYVGKDAAAHFLHRILDLEEKYLGPLKAGGTTMKEMTKNERLELMSCEDCYLCGEKLKNDRVVDHDHLTGEILGIAHNLCNLHRREKIRLVAFAHNFSGFDSHIIVKEMGTIKNRIRHMNAIPLNTQKFKTININRITILDSVAFLPDSLERLVNTLVISNHQFSILKQGWEKKEERNLLLRKGVYPYDFATSIMRLKNQTSLPPKSAFFNEIGQSDVTDEDYAHAEKVWKTFQLMNMQDYTELYVKSDTYLLAECVMNLRETIQNEFGLEISAYLSLPMLAKDIMLKTTGVEMDLIDDQEMSHLIQSNIRGGLSYVNTRSFELNNVDDEEKRAMIYLDANNLYGRAMCFPMPLRDFRWMSEEEIENFDLENDVTEKDGDGYILEVTLHYPKKLHAQHNSFPLAPEHIAITEEDLSPYSRSCLEQLSKPKKYRAEKLTATFRDRKKYLVHGLNLQFYLKMGIRLDKIHRGIKFHQASFLSPYILNCMEKRAKAKTKSEGDIMKLLSNALYGKFIEGTSNRMDCKFNYTDQNAMKRFNDPLFCGFLICSEDFSITFHKKKVMRMRQNWAVGFSILELSKLVMQRLFYEELKPRFNGELMCLMTDTDSWLLVAPASSPDEIVSRLKSVMDFSNYDESHPLYSKDRKNVVGYLKNEVPKDTITKFVGIRSKTYAFQTLNEKMESRAKGVKKCYKKKIPFCDFKKCLESVNEVCITQTMLQAKNHKNMLVRGEKVAFSSFDDKRYLLCPIHSVPYGSIFIKISERNNMCYFCKHNRILI